VPVGDVAARETQEYLAGGAGANLNHLHSPDEIKFCLGRHRLVNTFPPVFTGLSNFFEIEVGFYPICESIDPAYTCMDWSQHREATHSGKYALDTEY
jgi:hypothetical protein